NEGSGFGVAYEEPLFPPSRDWEHRKGVSGQRLPDMDLLRRDGSVVRLYRLLQRGCWLRLRFLPDAETISDLGPTILVDMRSPANGGPLANLASALVRPDGYLAHVKPVNDNLQPAKTEWTRA